MDKKKPQKPQKPQRKRQYYVINVPKEDLAFFEDLRISKSNFASQACLSFVATLKKEGKMDLYFRTNTIKDTVKKDNSPKDDDRAF